MKHCALRAGFEDLVHVVAIIDVSMSIKHTLCKRRLKDVHPYHWTEMYPTCLSCLAEDR